MATTLSSLKVTGTAVVAGLATLATVVITTLTVTTSNVTTSNVQTLSGATIKALQANGLVQARTLSGSAVFLTKNYTSGSVLCVRTTGVVGRCAAIPLASGLCTCNP